MGKLLRVYSYLSDEDEWDDGMSTTFHGLTGMKYFTTTSMKRKRLYM